MKANLVATGGSDRHSGTSQEFTVRINQSRPVDKPPSKVKSPLTYRNMDRATRGIHND